MTKKGMRKWGTSKNQKQRKQSQDYGNAPVARNAVSLLATASVAECLAVFAGHALAEKTQLQALGMKLVKTVESHRQLKELALSLWSTAAAVAAEEAQDELP